MKWRDSKQAIPKRREQPGERVLLKDQYGNVVIGTWRAYGGPFMIEGDLMPAGASYDLYQPLPK